MAVGQNQSMGSHFGVGAPSVLVYFRGDVHWGYDLDFDPGPYCQTEVPPTDLVRGTVNGGCTLCIPPRAPPGIRKVAGLRVY